MLVGSGNPYPRYVPEEIFSPEILQRDSMILRM
jgi:hypothetical protein